MTTTPPSPRACGCNLKGCTLCKHYFDTIAPGNDKQATQAILRAAQWEHDFGGWLARRLAETAALLGSTSALTANRPGSWEAASVQQLVKGTVGWGDEYLADHVPATVPIMLQRRTLGDQFRRLAEQLHAGADPQAVAFALEAIADQQENQP